MYLIDGTKARRWRADDEAEKDRAHDGYKKTELWTVMVHCDIFGRFIRVYITDNGAETDRNMYTDSTVYK